MSADITANRTAETSLSAIPLPVFTQSFLRWRSRSLDRRQRGNVGRDGGAIVGTEQRRVRDHFGHRSAGVIAVRIHAVAEKARNVFLRPRDLVAAPMTEAGRRDVGHPAFAVRRRAAGKPLAFDDAAEDIARRMTFGAVAGAVHQIGAAIPLRRL